MIDVNELRKGVTFTKDGELYKVVNYDHHKPGRGKATIRTTLRNLRSGSTIQENFNSGDRVQDIRGMDVVICTTSRTDDEARALLRGFNMPFRN